MDAQHPYCVLPHALRVHQELPESDILSKWQYGSFLFHRHHPGSVGQVSKLFAGSRGISLPSNFVAMIEEIQAAPEAHVQLAMRRRIFHWLLSRVSEVSEMEYPHDVVNVEWFCALLCWRISLGTYELNPTLQTLQVTMFSSEESENSLGWTLGIHDAKLTLNVCGPQESLQSLQFGYLAASFSLRCLMSLEKKTSGEDHSDVDQQLMRENILAVPWNTWDEAEEFFYSEPTISPDEWSWRSDTLDEQETNRVVVSFSFLRYHQPHNRLTQMLGSHQVMTVSFCFPQPNVEGDILNNHNPQLLSKEEFGAHLMCTKYGITSPQALKRLSGQERFIIKTRVDAIKRKIMQTVYVGGLAFRPLACNITGALRSRYIYTCVPHQEICQQVFDDHTEVIQESKPMLSALRLGLLNSTVIPTIPLSPEQWSLWTDVQSADGTQIFTDGSGLLSLEMAQQIFTLYRKNWFGKPEEVGTDPTLRYDHLRSIEIEANGEDDNGSWLSPNLPDWNHFAESHPDYCPSAFQIRYRGFKGVLVVSQEDGVWVRFRQSMLKFHSSPRVSSDGPYELNNDILYVCGISAPARAVTLSSELIYLFEAACDLEHQHALYIYLHHILIENREDCGGESVRDLLTPHSQAGEAYQNSRWMSREDHAIAQTLGVGACSLLLSHLIRLSVNLPQSAHVYGVSDQCNILAPTQVFLQVTQADGSAKVITGPIIMTKTPALESHDLRSFVGVDVPALSHLRDIVVFSVHGSCTPASGMASADLDGDQFYAMWDTRLVSLFPPAQKSPGEDLVHAASIPVVSEDREPTPYPHWNEHFSSTIVSALTGPINSLDYCSLGHLLCLRRLYWDVQVGEWDQECLSFHGDRGMMSRPSASETKAKICQQVASWLHRTFEAPKHGNWVEWNQVRTFLREALGVPAEHPLKLPRTPHYNPHSSAELTRHSTSLFGVLYDEMMQQLGGDGEVCPSCPSSSPMDYQIRLELELLAHYQSDESLMAWMNQKMEECRAFYRSTTRSFSCRQCSVKWNVFVNLFGLQIIKENQPLKDLSLSLIHKCGIPWLPFRSHSPEYPWAHVMELIHPSWDSDLLVLGPQYGVFTELSMCCILDSLLPSSPSASVLASRRVVGAFILRYGKRMVELASHYLMFPALIVEDALAMNGLAEGIFQLSKALQPTVSWLGLDERFSFWQLLTLHCDHPFLELSSSDLRPYSDWPTWKEAAFGSSEFPITRPEFDLFGELEDEIEEMFHIINGGPMVLPEGQEYNPQVHRDVQTLFQEELQEPKEGHVSSRWLQGFATHWEECHSFGMFRVVYVPRTAHLDLQWSWMLVYTLTSNLSPLTIFKRTEYLRTKVFWIQIQPEMVSDFPPFPKYDPFPRHVRREAPMIQEVYLLALSTEGDVSLPSLLCDMYTSEEKNAIREHLGVFYDALSSEISQERSPESLTVSRKEFFCPDIGYHSSAVLSTDTIEKLQTQPDICLKKKNMYGPIPPELGKLSHTRTLDLSKNSLTGEIPEEISMLRNLTSINLAKNQLTGPVPSFGECTVLEEIKLAHNQLAGPIPSELSVRTTLQVLDLRDNRCTGPIPPELASLLALRTLQLGENQLTGSIAILDRFPSLCYLDLRKNQFTGTIPRLSSELVILYLGHNQFSGSIPPLHMLDMLKFLDLSHNQLSGPLPSQWPPRLYSLNLSHNQLSGTLPLDWPRTLSSLKLGYNQLTGEIPASMACLDRMKRFHVQENQLSGPLPYLLQEMIETPFRSVKLEGNHFEATSCDTPT